MATVYTVEIEVVSDWVNYPPEQIEKELFKLMKKKSLHLLEIKAKRKA